jgi:hypothetical protein
MAHGNTDKGRDTRIFSVRRCRVQVSVSVVSEGNNTLPKHAAVLVLSTTVGAIWLGSLPISLDAPITIYIIAMVLRPAYGALIGVHRLQHGQMHGVA